MFTNTFHNFSLNESTFLVSGGAGFIGSNIVDYLLKNGAAEVRVLDNLSNGFIENLEEFRTNPRFKFIEGDIRNIDHCKDAVKGIDYISHQAALGSVPRSINDPATSNAVNVAGFLNMLVAAKDEGVKKMVYASSSSVYGDSIASPKHEGQEGNTMSPYAVTKSVNEQYGRVFSSVYGFHTIGLRYFNVFGPKQNPHGDYAAVIPRFIIHAINNTNPTIYGDGQQARDFTFVENAVQANIKAMLTEGINSHEVFNIAYGESYSVNTLWEEISNLFNCQSKPSYHPERKGDVRNSLASLEKATKIIGYNPTVSLKNGLVITKEYYINKFKVVI